MGTALGQRGFDSFIQCEGDDSGTLPIPAPRMLHGGKGKQDTSIGTQALPPSWGTSRVAAGGQGKQKVRPAGCTSIPWSVGPVRARVQFPFSF